MRRRLIEEVVEVNRIFFAIQAHKHNHHDLCMEFCQKTGTSHQSFKQ